MTLASPSIRLTFTAAFASLPLAAFAQVPLQNAPPPVSILPPTAPPTVAPAPIPLPEISAEQAAVLTSWLAQGAAHGVARPDATYDAADRAAIVATVIDRARAMHSGRLAAGDFLQVWALRPVAYDPLPAFVQAVQSNRLGAWLAALTPPYAGYDGLRKGLATYRAMQSAGGWPAIPGGPDMAIGAKGARIATLRARLRVEDNSVASTGAYDAALRDAVQRAQRRYGLNPTGSVGAQTLAALNVPVGDRIAAIVANMERWRWLPRELPTHRVQVNIAAAVLTVFEGDAPVSSMRAVTGRPGDETPMLESRIHSIVVNPPWNVPSSIANRELWPQEKKHPGTLAARGFKIIETPDGGKRLQQAAGPTSALGRLKFDFANPFAVYLHDTPVQAKFASFDRLASHGCVRLEKPVALAELMLKDDPAWGGTAVQDAIDTTKTTRVQLPEQVAVYLLYWTAFASANGQINFRGDPYGWDKLLAGKIDAAAARSVATPQKDVTS